MNNIPRLITPGVIAQRCNEPLSTASSDTRHTRTHWRCSRAGNVRLYDSEAVALVRHELHAIDARRASSPGRGAYASH